MALAQSHAFPSVPSKLLFLRLSRTSSLIPSPYIIGVYNIPITETLVSLSSLLTDNKLTRITHQDKHN